ncbi:acyl carrier protein phosphodiesterase [Flavobacterium sp. MFBS3-15]|uniref:acyl carrier protein phosphodiesterase n=1 Tax=Flavobacterium sp. MFBS3-15 TaxID=2989816 RepID=UPI0022354E0C|nr:acyl carrier protein phosphodiesterase [Flavobacterium sp. MFBS3-15]MCW4470896.1 acyl carrier protein phosphodiesterase [Flavobacterium sp. MFBS3-15]
MNFLAHIYLSGDNELLKIGNFIADGIHGKPDNFPPDVQKGIILHRHIDTYTDAHPIFRQGTKRLHAAYHHYAGVIMDIYYDHFLAKNWKEYSNIPLGDFVNAFYQSLQDNYELLTDRAKGMMPHMIKHDWLGSYATVEGISNILKQMDHRTKYRSGMGNSHKELLEFYNHYELEFNEFFTDIIKSVKEKMAVM